MTDILEKVARAIAVERFGDDGWREEDDGTKYFELCEGEAKAAASVLLGEMSKWEPNEEQKRAIFMLVKEDGDPDEQVPLFGSGQGDLQYVPAFENLWFYLSLSSAHQAIPAVFASTNNIPLPETDDE